MAGNLLDFSPVPLVVLDPSPPPAENFKEINELVPIP
jgi:hypothetical protein